MNQRIVEANCDISGLEELEGYTIDEIQTCTDASGEGFLIKAYRIVSGVKIFRDFSRQDDEYFISEEYIPNVHGGDHGKEQ